MIGFYIVLFFLYLFGPLVVMSVTAFNTPNYPTAYPFEGFTLDWFVKLWNHRAMMEACATPSSSASAWSPSRCRWGWPPPSS